MSRPLRLEFAGALYHITSRGNGSNLIYLQDDDFELFLQILAKNAGVKSCILQIFF
jgi:putative transposase